MKRRRLLLTSLLGIALAASACDGPDGSAPSPLVDESGAPLFEEGVEPGEQDTTDGGDDEGGGDEPGDGG